jgi:hypothetical protein
VWTRPVDLRDPATCPALAHLRPTLFSGFIAPIWRATVRRDEAERGSVGVDQPPEGTDVTDAPADDATSASDDDEAVKKVVDRQRGEMREFVKTLSADDIKSGNWFTKLLAHSLNAYTEKVDWAYFQNKYAGVPADAVVDQRVKMAARYAAIEGGLSASAYTGAVVATLGSGGGASPLTVPAAVTSGVVDVAFVTQLQLRLAYDIAVLYRVPLDTSDPEDLWKLIRVALTIRTGEAVQDGLLKAVPALMRQVVKRYYKGPVLAAAKGLPFVGKYLLQRNVIKMAIPGVGIPLAVVVNRYTTLVVGRHARSVFRNEARVIEVAESLTSRSHHPQLMLWVAWLVITANNKIAADEALLIRHLVRLAREHHQVVDEQLANLVDVDPADVWARVEAEP